MLALPLGIEPAAALLVRCLAALVGGHRRAGRCATSLLWGVYRLRRRERLCATRLERAAVVHALARRVELLRAVEVLILLIPIVLRRRSIKVRLLLRLPVRLHALVLRVKRCILRLNKSNCSLKKSS